MVIEVFKPPEQQSNMLTNMTDLGTDSRQDLINPSTQCNDTEQANVPTFAGWKTFDLQNAR